jgi:hypothetical protein
MQQEIHLTKQIRQGFGLSAEYRTGLKQLAIFNGLALLR